MQSVWHGIELGCRTSPGHSHFDGTLRALSAGAGAHHDLQRRGGPRGGRAGLGAADRLAARIHSVLGRGGAWRYHRLVPARAPAGAQRIRALLVAAHAPRHPGLAAAAGSGLHDHCGCLSAAMARCSGLVPRRPRLWLPLSWVVLYGCAFHAAGFFMPRGMKIFGWAFIVGGCVRCSPRACRAGRARLTTPTASWASSSAGCISPTASISTSPSSAGMRREPGTLPPARSCHPREGAAGHHVHAGRLAGALVHRNARRARA